MLTVVTWKWFGWRQKLYSPRHVMAMQLRFPEIYQEYVKYLPRKAADSD